MPSARAIDRARAPVSPVAHPHIVDWGTHLSMDALLGQAYPPARVARRRQRAFSLVDMMLGLAIFSAAILVTLALFPSSGMALRKSRMKLMATHVAQYQMEQVIRQSFASIASSTPSAVTLTTVTNKSRDVVAYNSQITVTSVSATVKDVVCVVTWTESGVQRNVTVETLVADKS